MPKDVPIPPPVMILIRDNPYDGSGGYPPHGFYHIYKVWDLDRGDMITVAYLSLEFDRAFAISFAKSLAAQYGIQHVRGQWVDE